MIQNLLCMTLSVARTHRLIQRGQARLINLSKSIPNSEILSIMLRLMADYLGMIPLFFNSRAMAIMIQL
jgi:hypothetical protein